MQLQEKRRTAFPDKGHTITCPHCKRNCQYVHPDSVITWRPADTSTLLEIHIVRVTHCAVCARPIVQYSHWRDGHAKTFDDPGVVYPIAPSRDLAPEVVRSADRSLADDYDEAVNCEPYSFQAPMFLLGRCAERILTEKAGAKPGGTLGKMINEVHMSLPKDWRDYLKEGFGVARNLAGHVWKDAAGNDLSVDDDTIEHGFAIIGTMFEHYYAAPSRMSDFTDKMERVVKLKREGERAATTPVP